MVKRLLPWDEALLRRSFGLAEASRARGDHPFGALLADDSGSVLLEAMNTCGTERDATGHAERNLMTAASRAHPLAVLRSCTLYTSAEPCAMCAGAAYWVGVGRVVYGLSEVRLKALTGSDTENLTMDLPCRTVFAAGQRRVDVIGPMLENEAAQVHAGFWST